jgi:predicted Zn-dependent protease
VKDKPKFGLININRIVLILILLLIPTIFSAYSTYFKEKIVIGIMITNDDLILEAEVAQAALDDFQGTFEAKILDTRFDESNVRVHNGKYLTNDYFNHRYSEQIRNEYNVDMILILTNKSINNWLDSRESIWGEANTNTEMAIITTDYFRTNRTIYETYISSISRHEILHLLGYEHPGGYRRCVMQYATLETELSTEYQLELSYRATLWEIGSGKNFGEAVFLINLTMLLLFSPIFIALILIMHYSFKNYLYKTEKISLTPLIFGIGLFYVNILLFTRFIILPYLRIIGLLTFTLVYVIIELFVFNSSLKKRSDSEEKEKTKEN